MRFKIIIVEPRYQINLGYIARVSRNFGIRRLFLVRPRTIIGKRAIMFSKHAADLLKDAQIYATLGSATADCDIVVGTTGLRSKSGINFKRIYLIDDAVKRLERIGSGKTIGILIGRDDIGLKRDEIEKCDMIAYIGTDQDYPVLNISHALGIILYLLTAKGFASVYKGGADPRRKEALNYLMKSFAIMIGKKRIRDRKAVKNVFRRLVSLSQPNLQEIHALITAFK
ncbi:MAG: RNA methyltransferase [Candidatus Marsarchaeota archaeon]|nr:RNA methyltransferase [Candidatus Marsarchaeota archaeon]MCL5413258.1 RNA methyltransferase [Candidatus Marsarchaeota archaeon]